MCILYTACILFSSYIFFCIFTFYWVLPVPSYKNCSLVKKRPSTVSSNMSCLITFNITADIWRERAREIEKEREKKIYLRLNIHQTHLISGQYTPNRLQTRSILVILIFSILNKPKEAERIKISSVQYCTFTYRIYFRQQTWPRV